MNADIADLNAIIALKYVRAGAIEPIDVAEKSSIQDRACRMD